MIYHSQNIGMLAEFYRLLHPQGWLKYYYTGFSSLHSQSGLHITVIFQCWISSVGCLIPMWLFWYIAQQYPFPTIYTRAMCAHSESFQVQTLHQEDPLKCSHAYDFPLNRTAIGFWMRSSLFTDFTSSWDSLWSSTDLYNVPTFHLSLPDTKDLLQFPFEERSVNSE
jgi:hypothetical protein